MADVRSESTVAAIDTDPGHHATLGGSRET